MLGDLENLLDLRIDAASFTKDMVSLLVYEGGKREVAPTDF